MLTNKFRLIPSMYAKFATIEELAGIVTVEQEQKLVAKEDPIRELVWEMVRVGIFGWDNEWAWKVVSEGGTEMVERVFRFQAKMLNVVRRCPRELIEKIYYEGIIKAMVKNYD